MFTTKRKIAEQVQRMIFGGQPSQDVKVDIRELMIGVNQQFALAVKQSWFNNRTQGEYDINGGLIYTFENVPVLLNSARDLYYSELPSTYIDLPNEIGINHVGLMKGDTKAFKRVSPDFLTTSRGTASASLQNHKGFWVENTRLYYVNIDATSNITEVLMRLACALDGIDDDDNINMPPDIQAQIVQNVFAMYMPMQQNPMDTIDDNKKVITGGRV